MGESSHSNASDSPVARWFVAVIAIFYGFSKIVGAQFVVLDSELARPLGEVSGFWLTWHYFGYSTVYKLAIAAVEIVGGVLLPFRRTSLLGALILLPAFVNIVLIDVLYAIDLGALIAAVITLIGLAAIVGPHVDRLLNAVLLEKTRIGLGRIAVVVSIVVAAAGFNWWIRHRVVESPTPLDGIWIEAATHSEPTTVFFEKNRAHLAVFRAPGQRDLERHFEVDDQGVVRIWTVWLRKDRLLLEGRLNSRNELELQSRAPDAPAITLRRR